MRNLNSGPFLSYLNIIGMDYTICFGFECMSDFQYTFWNCCHNKVALSIPLSSNDNISIENYAALGIRDKY